jgi:hypothetical protein
MNTIKHESGMTQSSDWAVEKFREDCLRLESRLEGLFPWEVFTEVECGPDVRARITCTFGVVGHDPELVFVVEHDSWDGGLEGIDRDSLHKFWVVLPYCKAIEVHLVR